MHYSDFNVAILGFGVEGQDAARYFLGQKSKRIVVFDKRSKVEVVGRQWWGTTGCFRDTLLGSGDIIDGDVGTALRAIVGSWGTSIVGNDTFTRVGFITRDQWRGRRRGSYSTITTT